jgi:hypothetical protein
MRTLGGHRFWLWFAVLSGPFWWMVHITGVSALASGACGHHAYTWLAHGLTVATAVPVLYALSLCRTLVRANREDGNVVLFLGNFGLFVGGLSLALILFEEVYIWVVRICA